MNAEYDDTNWLRPIAVTSAINTINLTLDEAVALRGALDGAIRVCVASSHEFRASARPAIPE